jgi:hypothetical protein
VHVHLVTVKVCVVGRRHRQVQPAGMSTNTQQAPFLLAVTHSQEVSTRTVREAPGPAATAGTRRSGGHLCHSMSHRCPLKRILHVSTTQGENIKASAPSGSTHHPHLNVLYGRMRTLWPIILILCRLGCRLNSTRSPFCRWRSTLSPICAQQQQQQQHR